jgi:flagellar biosynthesis protein FlhB
MAAEEKTEQPSSHKMAEARKKGQAFKSQELTFSVSIIVFLLVLHSCAGGMFKSFLTLTGHSLSRLEIGELGIFNELQGYAFTMLKIMAPVIITCFAAAILANIFQVGFMFSTQSLLPSLGKLNPLEGFKRIYSRRGIFELAKNSVKVILTFIIVADFIKSRFLDAALCLHQSVRVSFFSQAGSVYTLGMRIGLLFLLLALFDYLYQRREFMENMKMTKQEVKEEYKQLEGDPFLKGRQREIRAKYARARMMEGVKKARVIITNPTHVACALKYDDAMETPMLVAKGQDFVAHNIVKIAREHGVHVMENKPLAWAIYKEVEIDHAIPPSLYPMVAEVIFFIMQLEEHTENQ